MPYGDQDIGPLLESLGYVHVSGWGPSAVWAEPDTPVFDQNGKPVIDPATKRQRVTPGARFLQQEVANARFGADSPYAQPKAPPAQPTPRMEYEPDGRAYYWTSAYGAPTKQYVPESDDPTQAAGYQAPSRAQPLQPHLYNDRNGDIVALDPYTFAERARISGAQWATLSPEQQRAIELGDIAAARAFTTGERIAAEQARAVEAGRGRTAAVQEAQAGRQFSAGEAATGRAFSAHQSAYDRALRAAEFAANQAQSERGLQFNVEQANRQGFAQAERDRLGAARQYADLVSSTDTAALPAYLQAGGGVLWNARQARPEGLLTANAVNPAAASLRSAETMGYQPITLPPPRGFEPPPYQPWQEPRMDEGLPQQTATPRARGLPPRDATGAVVGPEGAGWTTNYGPLPGGGWGVTGNTPPPGVQGFAGGTQGFIHAPREFMTGEQGPELQQVYDPPGPDNAMLRVVPGFALGTDADPQGLGIDTAGLDPYAQRVREFRRGFQGPQLDYGMFDPRFSRVYSPQVRQSYFMGQQTQRGVPAEALAWESQRFTPRGFSRGALGLSY